MSKHFFCKMLLLRKCLSLNDGQSRFPASWTGNLSG